MQSSTTPDPGYQLESVNLQLDTTNESQEVSPFPAGSLKGRPLCHTLSNALRMSQNTAQTSLPSSRDLQNVLYMSTSLFTVESLGIKPDCKADKIS